MIRNLEEWALARTPTEAFLITACLWLSFLLCWLFGAATLERAGL